jgi:uncharacterized protein YecE (DUF72 family)
LAQYYIGTSGWHYDDWRGRFYPDKLPRAHWLEFYASRFTTLELNNTFYRLPPEKVFHNWHDASPAGFLFAVKVSRFITHIKRLRDCDEALYNFMSRAVLLGEKLGPLLYQLPPGLHRDDALLTQFLEKLPRDLDHIIEFRHASWLEEEVFVLLRRYNVGFCIYDMPDKITPVIATADFAYVRFHGSGRLYAGRYSDEELKKWAEEIGGLPKELKAVYIYFNNDVHGYAIENAETLRNLLKTL